MSKSPNYWNGRNGWKPDIIVCHITEGSFNSAVSWLTNTESRASAHYVVGAKGEVENLVDLKNTAWCNGDINKPTNTIVKSRGSNPNYYTYSIEHEGFSYKDRYGDLTESQYQSTLKCMKEIIRHMKNEYNVDFQIDRNHIIGHYEINSIGKVNCPGKNFPFNKIINDLKQWSQPKPFELNTVIYPIKDLELELTAGYGDFEKMVLRKGTKCFVRKYHDENGLYMALGPSNSRFFDCAWTNDFASFTIEEPIIEDNPVEEDITDEEASDISPKHKFFDIIINFIKKIVNIFFKKEGS